MGDGARSADDAAGGLRRRVPTWPGYAACAWALVFAAQRCYHAAGGTAGAETIGPAIAEPVVAREPLWVAALCALGGLKVVAALVALATVRAWGRRGTRGLLLAAGWAAVAVMASYEGAASPVQHALMVAGVIATPAGLGPTAARWRLLLWDPWRLRGGILFGLATWRYQRRTGALRAQ
ncbi:MAG: DUF3995 domain-containing protein [Sphaerobacter sp.]|nr:DUF3995 domain-containing protein [Sphaerobacter sp.]